MTGAGISVDSGVPTFQGTEGLWARFGKPKMNAYSDFLKNPESWWDREINHQRSPYVLELRKAIEGSKPNLGHKVLFEMENKNIISLSDDEEQLETLDLPELDYLDSWVGDDYWHRKYEKTGSIDLDPDWF